MLQRGLLLGVAVDGCLFRTFSLCSEPPCTARMNFAQGGRYFVGFRVVYVGQTKVGLWQAR